MCDSDSRGIGASRGLGRFISSSCRVLETVLAWATTQMLVGYVLAAGGADFFFGLLFPRALSLRTVSERHHSAIG